MLSDEDLMLFIEVVRKLDVNDKENIKKMFDSLTREELLQVKEYLNSLN